MMSLPESVLFHPKMKFTYSCICADTNAQLTDIPIAKFFSSLFLVFFYGDIGHAGLTGLQNADKALTTADFSCV